MGRRQTGVNTSNLIDFQSKSLQIGHLTSFEINTNLMMHVTLNIEVCQGCVPASCWDTFMHFTQLKLLEIPRLLFFPFLLAVLIRFKGQSLTCDQESGPKLMRLQLFAVIQDE